MTRRSNLHNFFLRSVYLGTTSPRVWYGEHGQGMSWHQHRTTTTRYNLAPTHEFQSSIHLRNVPSETMPALAATAGVLGLSIRPRAISFHELPQPSEQHTSATPKKQTYQRFKNHQRNYLSASLPNLPDHPNHIALLPSRPPPMQTQSIRRRPPADQPTHPPVQASTHDSGKPLLPQIPPSTTQYHFISSPPRPHLPNTPITNPHRPETIDVSCERHVLPGYALQQPNHRPMYMYLQHEHHATTLAIKQARQEEAVPPARQEDTSQLPPPGLVPLPHLPHIAYRRIPRHVHRCFPREKPHRPTKNMTR